jgi:hypothetical protein
MDLLKPNWIQDAMLIHGGCGPGKWGDYVIPDRLLGLDVSMACKIHDRMYEFAENQYDKLKADSYFLSNLVFIIIDGSNWLTRIPRLWLAWRYFLAVLLCGRAGCGEE